MVVNIDDMSVLLRRRIEAGVLGPVFKAFAEEVGIDRAREVMGKAIVQIAREQGRALAQRSGSNDLTAFASAREPWTRDDALESEVLEHSDTGFSFNVTRCRYADMYREMGLSELGFILSCGRDFALSQGFSPDIKLTRTQTIMQGASHCDFRYKLQPRGESDDGADDR